MLFLYRFFCGVLEIELSGIYPEKIFDLLERNRIAVWNSRYSNKKICLFITIKDFKKLPKILKKSGIKVHITSKKGFPFFISKYKKRFGVFLGIILFLAVLEFLSSFIWIIDVEGNKTVSYNEILSACDELGVNIGTRCSQINAKAKAQELLLKMEKLSWASLNIEGCRLTVNVTEVTEKKEDNSVATNLKAKSDGVITRIDVTSGNCVVKVGDFVKKGDLLVSGIWERADGTRFVHSIGSVMADTEKVLCFKEPLMKRTKSPTGKTKEKKVLEFFSIKIPLYLGKTHGDFETEIKSENLILFAQKLPIVLHEKKFIFVENKMQKREYEKVCEILEEKLIKGQKEKGFTVKSKEIITRNNDVILKVVINQNEEITYSENLTFTIGN